MEHSYKRSQARSLAFSVIGHSALVALCIYLSRHIGEQMSAPEKQKSGPASVQWLPSMPSRGEDVLPAGTPDGDSIEDGAVIPQPELVPKEMAQPLEEAREALDAATARETTPEAAAEDTISADEAQSEAPASAPYAQADTMAAPAQDGYQTGYQASGHTRPQAAGTRRRISGADFMGAFHRSMYTERAETQKTGGGSGTGNGKAIGGTAHIQERLSEWGKADYHEKIARALIKAAKIHRKYVHSPVYVNKKIYVTLILDEKGAIKNLDAIEKLGIHDLDEFIREFFLKTDFPPIPRRFNMSEFTHHLTITLTLSEGSHSLQLRPISEN